MLNTFAYAYEFWLVDFLTRRKLDVHFTQSGQRVFKRQGYTYHKSVFHAFLHLHFGIGLAIPPKHKGSSSASTADDQLTSLIYFVNESELPYGSSRANQSLEL
jgi:hypothetical protein